MRVKVTCECCGARFRLARLIWEPQTIRVVCNACEELLEVQVSRELIARRIGSPAAELA